MCSQEVHGIGRKTVSFLHSFLTGEFQLPHLIFELILSAFPGILNWQHRIWLCLSEFNKIRNDDTITKPEENNTNYENEDLSLFEIRNFCVSKTERAYSDAHFSSAVKKCQELTDELRV